MRCGRERHRCTGGGTRLATTGQTVTVAGAGGTARARHRSAHLQRTRGDCTTCTATCGSGWRTAGTATTKGRLGMGRPGRRAGTVVGVCCVAVPGPTSRGSSVRRTASGSMSGAGSALSVSVWRGRPIRSCLFRSLLLGGSGGHSPLADPVRRGARVTDAAQRLGPAVRASRQRRQRFAQRQPAAMGEWQ